MFDRVPRDPDLKDVECILQELVSLLDDLDFPRGLQTLGVEESALADMADQVINSPLAKVNLRKTAVSQVHRIYEAAFSGSNKG